MFRESLHKSSQDRFGVGHSSELEIRPVGHQEPVIADSGAPIKNHSGIFSTGDLYLTHHQPH